MSDEIKITPGLAKAMKRFVRGIDGKGITSVTISVGDRSVVIDKEAAENVRRNADQIIKKDKE